MGDKGSSQSDASLVGSNQGDSVHRDLSINLENIWLAM
jgi:hypothetical protein